jgi:nitrite reductase (NO-forming)
LSRCPRRRPIDPRSPRPSGLLAAFFAAGIAFMLAAAVFGAISEATGVWWQHWVALHLLFLGGISQLVLGAAQFFTCAFLATDPPSRRLIGAQLGAWNAGTILIAIGVPTATTPLVDAGGILIAAGLALFVAALVTMDRRSLQQARWALRWYQASAACLGAGALLGVLMARGTVWTHGSLLGAHLALNLGGWFGTAIVGTLHTFFPSLTQTQLRHPRLQAPTFWLWLAGIAELAAGAAFDSRALVTLAWLDLLVAAGLLAVNLAASLRASTARLSLAARLLTTGQLFLVAGAVVALIATLRHGTAMPFIEPWRGALATLLIAGWIGLTVAGSLLHLLAVLARVRDLRRPLPVPHPLPDSATTLAAGAAVAALALSRAPSLGWLTAAARPALLAVAALLAMRILALAARALRSRPVRAG